MNILDIETRPRPDLVRRFIKPFAAFDESAVKYGNTKDPQKRADLLAEKRAAHEAEEAAYWRTAEERAALNPLTAEIVVIGLILDGRVTILQGDERTILTQFWSAFDEHHGGRFVYWSGNGAPSENFDPDMIIRRSWILGVPVSAFAFDGRYLGRRFDDAAARYLLFKREAYCSLTRAADELGLYTTEPGLTGIFPKSEDDPVTGENFHLFWDGKANERLAAVGRPAETPEQQRAWAINYLVNDLLTLKAIVRRIYPADAMVPDPEMIRRASEAARFREGQEQDAEILRQPA